MSKYITAKSISKPGEMTPILASPVLALTEKNNASVIQENISVKVDFVVRTTITPKNNGTKTNAPKIESLFLASRKINDEDQPTDSK